MEDRYIVIPEIKLDHLHAEEDLQLVDTFKTNKKRKKKRKSDNSSASNEKVVSTIGSRFCLLWHFQTFLSNVV